MRDNDEPDGEPTVTLQRIDLTNFKAFERFTCRLRPESTFLIGPNNAGKSTLVAALRTAASMLQHARQRKPDDYRLHGATHHHAYTFSSERHGLKDQNLAFEMRADREVSIGLFFDDRSSLRAVWPAEHEEDGRPFFYLLDRTGVQPRRPTDVRAAFPAISTIPVLSPVEAEESVLSEDYVRGNLGTRLSSRHFRNQLALLKGGGESAPDWDGLLEAFAKWCPEISVTHLRNRWSGDSTYYDLFYTEPGRRAEKELSWAGDGIQVWLQLITQIERLRNQSDVIILDEPDLFLHADLQRRLVRLVDSVEGQVVMATHSAEIIGEAEVDSLVWVDKSRRASVRRPSEVDLREFGTELGTQFNIGLARALRSSTVLFVEGDDLRILRRVAQSLGLARLTEESSIAVVPLGGRSRAPSAQAFKMIVDAYLGNHVKAFVILDRDYWSDERIAETEEEFRSSGLLIHVWRRKELENYLLEPRLVGSLLGVGVSEARDHLLAAAEASKHLVFGQMLEERLGRESGSGRHRSEVTAEFSTEFETNWRSVEFRLYRSPAKEVLGHLNRSLGTSISFTALARRARPADLDPEMVKLLRDVEAA